MVLCNATNLHTETNTTNFAKRVSSMSNQLLEILRLAPIYLIRKKVGGMGIGWQEKESGKKLTITFWNKLHLHLQVEYFKLTIWTTFHFKEYNRLCPNHIAGCKNNLLIYDNMHDQILKPRKQLSCTSPFTLPLIFFFLVFWWEKGRNKEKALPEPKLKLTT